MSSIARILKHSAIPAMILSLNPAWAQTACNGAVAPSVLSPDAGDSSGNPARGTHALPANTIGFSDAAFGLGALQFNARGAYNSAFGYQAGNGLSTESNDIDIANSGVPGDSGVVRIGTAGVQKAVYVAGIDGVSADHGRQSAVYIDANGQLGTRVSSVRYKQDIEDMGERSSLISELRPVTYRYKSNPEDRQYGLIAEEVDKIFPDLVIRREGVIQTVDYEALIPMLLNEIQKQQREIAALKTQADVIATLKAALTAQGQRLSEMEAKNARIPATVATR